MEADSYEYSVLVVTGELLASQFSHILSYYYLKTILIKILSDI